MSRPHIAVLGAGRMGTAIAYLFAASGHPVWLHDPDPAALDRADAELARISALRGNPAGRAGKAAASALRRSADLAAAVCGAGLVIEAVPERADLKQQIFAELGALTGAETILASNTSAIPIRDLAAGVPAPGRVLGTHFWNPPYAVKLVEVVQAPATTAATVAAAMQLLDGAGMRPVHVKRDVPGFVGNRLQHALKREAIALVASGVCDAETIDTVTKLGFGARLAVLGPMEQSDLVGLDLTLAIHETLMPDLDTTPVPHPLLVDLVARGELGMNSGRGFRAWTAEQAQEVRDRLDAHLLATSAERHG